MSYKATNWAYEMKITAPAKPVLVALADMADEDASCYPGQEKLSAMTGLSVRTVARALQRLEDLGLLVRHHRYGSLGYRTSDRYQLQLAVDNPENLPDREPTRQKTYLTDSQTLPATVTVPTGHSDRAEENHQFNHQLNHQGERARAQTPPDAVDNPEPFCSEHMPYGPSGTSCRGCADAKRAYEHANRKPVSIPPRVAVDPELCDHKFVGGWCVWCPTPQPVVLS